METMTILNLLGAAIAGGGIAFLIVRPKAKILESVAKEEAERIRKSAHQESERMVEDARKHAHQIRDNIQKEEQSMRARLIQIQEKADERNARQEEILEQKIEKAQKAREENDKQREVYEAKIKDLQKEKEAQTQELEKIAKLSKDEAKKTLVEKVEKEHSKELAQVLHRKVELTRQTADEQASEIIVQSIQRYASNVTTDATITLVKIESDGLKGKIIGREGRNINAFEMMTGVDVIIDDTPNSITLSSYDMFRRYVAKKALELLLKDGRIHPSKIEECVRKAQELADKFILDIGQRTVQELGISTFPEQILKLLGRLRFRTSYGQNVLNHSIEVAYLAEAIAYQLKGADPEVCKRAGILHDIGKAVSHEVEGGHAMIGAEILEKFGIAPEIITAMKSHHEDFPYESLEARILQAADAISASRPGARKETLEKYIKRLKELEAIATGFEGVEKVFAIQAGREIRVFVNAKEVDDLQSEKMSFEIARKIEKSCEYPGEVQVAVYRETKFEDTAK